MKIFNFFKNKKPDTRFDLLPDGVLILEHDGKIIDANLKALELLDTNTIDIIGNYFSDFIKDGTSILNKIVLDGSIVYVQSSEALENGKASFYEMNASRNSDTNLIYVCLREVDKDREQKLNELITTSEKYHKAKQIVDNKNEFLSSSQGAILSSLVSVCGFSRALLDGFAGNLSDKQRKYLNIINTNSKDLNYDLEHLFKLFSLEAGDIKNKNGKVFDIVSLIKSIERVYEKDFKDRKVIFNLNYSQIKERDCYLDSETVEYILRCILDIFLRFSVMGKCFLNIGHPPEDFLKSWDFEAKKELKSEKYILFEAKVTDLIFSKDELDNIFNAYYPNFSKRPIGLRATLNLLKIYINGFGGEIKVYSKPNFGTMFTFVLPLKMD